MLRLEAWRAVSRPIAIQDSTSALAALLRRELPLARVVVRTFDHARPAIATVAEDPSPRDSSPECTPAEVQAMIDWCRRAEMFHGDPRAVSAFAGALGLAAVTGDVMAGPLGEGEAALGVVLLVASDGRRFSARHGDIVRSFLEPFTVAVENDRHLREVTTLREAAEADRRSALARLGRQDLADRIVGADTGLRQVIERIELVSRSDAPVLILGETGSGKELVARAIRDRSSRAAGPFIRVNCGSIPQELIDTELFGHERGAFTGAVAARKGWFERADGGTLFLDEIGELTLAAQVRLLHVLQDGHFERVGSQETVRVDVRIITATHQDLTAMVRRGLFREDLWYRIAVFPILVPPLRERPEDIPALAIHCSERAAIRFGLPVRTPDAQELELLVAYQWPGNVRELAAVIDRAAILGNGRRLEVEAALGSAGSRTRAEAPRAAPVDERPGRIPILPFDDAVRRHVEAALRATRGRIEGPAGAALALGVNPHTLRGRMRRLGITWKDFRARGS